MSTKTASLLYAVILIVLFALPISIDKVGLTEGDMIRRITYQHFHANVWHLLCNLWALLTFSFIVRTPLYKFIFAFAVSATYPFVDSNLIVGLSGMLYCLAGMYAFNNPTLKGIVRYNILSLGFILIGMIFPFIGVGIHLYCYTIGAIYSLFNKPIL